MKNKLSFALLLSIFSAILFLGSSGGAGKIQGIDRTGSPLSPGTCFTCHGGGDYNPTLAVQVLDNNEPVLAYVPGQTYTLRVRVTPTNGQPEGFGFQTVALSGAGDVNAGTFGAPPSGTQLTPLNNRIYFEHAQLNGPNTWTIDWTAPASGTGPVRFYASGNAVNGNNNNQGDSPVTLETPVMIAEAVSGVSGIGLPELQLRVFPNPVADRLNLEVAGHLSGEYRLCLLDAAGMLVYEGHCTLQNGKVLQQLPVGSLPAGRYVLHLSDGLMAGQVSILKI